MQHQNQIPVRTAKPGRSSTGRSLKIIRSAIVIVSAVVIAVVLFTLRPQAKRRQISDPHLLVKVARIEPQDLQMTVEAFGTVRPKEVLRLVAEVPGQVISIYQNCAEGCFFPAKADLIRIDPRTFQLEVQRRRIQITQTEAELARLAQERLNLTASLEIARSDTALAESEFKRLQTLSGRNVVAMTTRDQAEQRYLGSRERLQTLQNQFALLAPRRKQLLAQLEMARVMWRQAELDLEKTVITAPFDGWLLEKQIERGQHVSPGQVLGAVYRDGAYEIEVRVPVKDLKWLPALEQTPPPAAAIHYGPAGNRQHRQGRVVRVKATMDEKTRTLPVVVAVDTTAAGKQQDGYIPLRPGMFVTVRIQGRPVPRVFMVPRYMVYPGDKVFAVENKRLALKPVNVIRRFKDVVYVDEGVSAQTLLVKTPLSEASEGLAVQVVKE